MSHCVEFGLREAMLSPKRRKALTHEWCCCPWTGTCLPPATKISSSTTHFMSNFRNKYNLVFSQMRVNQGPSVPRTLELWHYLSCWSWGNSTSAAGNLFCACENSQSPPFSISKTLWELGNRLTMLAVFQSRHLWVLAVRDMPSCPEQVTGKVCRLQTLEQVAYHLSCFKDLGWFKLLKVLQGTRSCTHWNPWWFRWILTRYQDLALEA